MLIADLDKKDIRVTPFADPEAKLVELRITFSDIPGALAKAANILATQGIDLLSSESRTLRRGKSAEWIMVADISRCQCTLEELEKKIVAEGTSEGVKFRDYS